MTYSSIADLWTIYLFICLQQIKMYLAIGTKADSWMAHQTKSWISYEFISATIYCLPAEWRCFIQTSGPPLSNNRCGPSPSLWMSEAFSSLPTMQISILIACGGWCPWGWGWTQTSVPITIFFQWNHPLSNGRPHLVNSPRKMIPAFKNSKHPVWKFHPFESTDFQQKIAFNCIISGFDICP